MFSKLEQIWKVRDLRNNIFCSGILGCRFAAHIPIPGVDAIALKNLFASIKY